MTKVSQFDSALSGRCSVLATGSSLGPEPMIDNPQDHPRVCLRLRQALALPIYAVALILSFLSDLLGKIAAKIAGDD
jgi:hypothetical protein